MTRRTRACGALLLALLLPLTGCGGGHKAATKEKTPAQVLALAKQKFDDSPSVHLLLKTDSVPTSGNAVLGADGVLTQAPAFQGSVDVFLSGLRATVPVTSVGGKVYAKLPLTVKYAVINPAEYGAPDPASFVDKQRGISTLLTELQGVTKGADKRNGAKILSTYSGSLAGSQVKPIIPSASASGTYQTVIGIDPDGYITTLEVTGAFFSGGGGSQTYTMTLDSYGKSVEITKP